MTQNIPLKDRLSDTDRAYLAGLFDGEGCVGYYKRKGNRSKYSYVSVVMITQSNSEFMNWLHALIGFGNVTSRAGKKHFEYHWQANKRANVFEFLEAIEPYLVIKKKQAQVLISHLREEGLDAWAKGSVTEDVLQRRDSIYRKLRHLKIAPMLAVNSTANQ